MRKGGSPSARRWLRQTVRRMAARVRPQKVVLFGSYAYGRPKADSDIDLLVILKRPMDREKRYARVDREIGEHRWPLDIIVRDRQEVEDRLRLGDSFFMDILKRGKVLYES